MAQAEDVRNLIASILLTAPETLDQNTSLRSLDNSLHGTRLQLGLKRLGIKPGFRRVPPTLGELERVLAGAASAAVSPMPTLPLESPSTAIAMSAADGAPRIGHDIQDLGSMPVTADYWEHEFYSGAFSPLEIAYAVLQSEPREHFAGFWAAKEALRKCDPAFGSTEFKQLIIAHQADGRPFFVDQSADGARLPHAVSISHSAATASAVVLSPAAALGVF